jgi:hypothetical protein
MSLPLKALMAPELLTPAEVDVVDGWRRARERRQKIIDDLLASAIKGELPWPGSHDA